MDSIFEVVYEILKWTSGVTGLTYHEVNIIVYYILIPAFFFLLIGRIFNSRIPIIMFSAIVIIAVLLVPNFEIFSTSLFEKSVHFLKLFEHIGLNYVQASVVICVFLPVLMIIALLYFKRRTIGRTNKS